MEISLSFETEELSGVWSNIIRSIVSVRAIRNWSEFLSETVKDVKHKKNFQKYIA